MPELWEEVEMRLFICMVLFFGALVITILYSALVVASDADDKEEDYWNKRGG